MAQSALSVTPPNPSPPSNMACTGATPPNVPNYTKTSYANPFNLTARTYPAVATAEVPTTPYGVNPSPAPYFDDGTAGALQTFATNTAALASGTSTTSGGTEGTYPGTSAGAVPASSSVAHEAAGTEVTVLAPGNIQHTYVGAVTLDMSRSASVGPAATAASVAAGPNASHASTLSPATNPALTSITPGSTVSGAGNTTLGATGTNFTRQSVVYVNGVAQTTTFVSATSLTCAAVAKKATAGPWNVIVVTGGAVQTAAQVWTFT